MLSPFWELMREFRKMRYLFDTSHQLGYAKFNRILPSFQMTDVTTVLLSGLAPDIHPDEPVRASRLPITAE